MIEKRERLTFSRTLVFLSLLFCAHFLLRGGCGALLSFSGLSDGVGWQRLISRFFLNSFSLFLPGILYLRFSGRPLFSPRGKIRPFESAGYTLSLYFLSVAFGWAAGALFSRFLPAAGGGTLPPRIGGIADAALFWIADALLPAFCEEFFCRHVLFGEAAPFGKARAIVISSLCFGLMHPDPVKACYAFFCGLLLGYAALKSGGWLLPFVMHLGANTLNVLVTVLTPLSTGGREKQLFGVLFFAALAAGAISIAVIVFFALRRIALSKKTALPMPEEGGGGGYAALILFSAAAVFRWFF